MPTALVTRPREDSRQISAALAERGFHVQVEPFLDIVLRRDQRLDLDGVQGFLATSANGVRALVANQAPLTLPLWAVGDATARTARDLGFETVASAGGDVETLAALVAQNINPNQGALLHAAGSAVAGDLAGRLGQGGFEVRRQVLYDAQATTALSPALLDSLDHARIDLALFFSPRTATSFVTLTQAAGRGDACRNMIAFALSTAVAHELAVLPWHQVYVAAHPDQAALLACIDRFFGADPGSQR